MGLCFRIDVCWLLAVGCWWWWWFVAALVPLLWSRPRAAVVLVMAFVGVVAVAVSEAAFLRALWLVAERKGLRD